MSDLLLKSILIGICISAPVGPIGVFCIRRLIVYGLTSGLVSSFGAFLADCIYCTIVLFGISHVSGIITKEKVLFSALSSAFLVILGLRILLSKRPVKSREGCLKSKDVFHDLLSTFVFTITNPIAVLSFVALFGVFNIGVVSGVNIWQQLLILVLGLFLGVVLWWSAIIGFMYKFNKNKNQSTVVPIVNKISGVIILLFAVMSGFEAYKAFSF